MIQNPKKTIVSLRLNNYRFLHVFIITIIPLAGTILAFLLLYQYKITWVEISLLLVMWFVSGLGITVGFHRLFAHKAFRTNRYLKILLIIIGSMAVQGPLIYWVALHRRHHENSDKLGDPHSPHLTKGKSKRLKGFWHAHIGWMFAHDIPNPGYYAPELIRDRIIARTSQFYLIWVFLGFLIPTVLGGILRGELIGFFYGFLWGGLVRLFLGEHFIWSINSIAHLLGNRPFKTSEYSTNVLILAIPTLGESWHNNHHAFSNSAIFGLEWWQIDIGGYVIRILERMKLITEVNYPSSNLIKSRRADKV